jgi:NADPH:quinone reductase-like Zn-dependent oxidoreductase
MKAIVLKNISNIEELRKNLVIEDIDIPKIKQDEVLVKIKYAALNHRDLWICKGLYAGIKLPVVLGSDCSGIVQEIGKDVTEINVGDEVVINPSHNWGEDENFQGKDFRILGLPENGTLQEYISINKKYIYKKPVHLDLTESSALPLAGLTAYRAVLKKAMVKENDNVVISGIGGGVSTFALLFSKAIGAKIFVTSGTQDKINKAIGFGAMGGVNYKVNDWEKNLAELTGKKIDVLIDGTAGETVIKIINIMSPGGRIVNYGVTTGNPKEIDFRKIFWKQLKLMGTTMGSDSDFGEMIGFIIKHKIRPVIDKIFGFEEYAEAFERMIKAEQLGKIVILIS